MHGGKSARGAQASQYKTGRYSKYLPPRMLAQYQESLKDGELLALRDEISLIDSRLTDILGKVDTGESGSLWKGLNETLKRFNAARASGDTDTMAQHLATIGHLIERGAADWAAWREVRSLIQERCRVVESERKRLLDMQQMVTTEQATLLVTALVDSVRRHVTDHKALTAIATDINKLLHKGEQLPDNVPLEI